MSETQRLRVTFVEVIEGHRVGSIGVHLDFLWISNPHDKAELRAELLRTYAIGRGRPSGLGAGAARFGVQNGEIEICRGEIHDSGEIFFHERTF